jgi:hypothetical protein
VPNLSLAAPQPNPAIPIVRKSMVMALEIPARDQPVSVDIGSKYTASENIAPMPTHVISAPAPTITQRYDSPMRKCSCFDPSGPSGCAFLE